ncbi:hexokinase-2-like isoform X1 [Pieris brassicae]|uniref:hexokinase-2-like isoform X1 n=2 Tax=Pieris brassicae TaxID=7116 RepID=UPI001E65F8B5|nr:hexokinase-2-like isoform X1 [Pieris brassicae]
MQICCIINCLPKCFHRKDMSTVLENGRAGVDTHVNGHIPYSNGNGTMNGTHATNGTNGITNVSNGTINGTHGVNGSGTPWEKQFLPPSLQLEDKARALKVESKLSGLVLCGATLRQVGEVFAREIENGLREKPSSLQMENTYVPELPDGTEEGVFLALDLGGTNFRVLYLELRGGQLVREDVKHYHISDELRVGPGVDLFNFLADCVQDFLRSEGMEKDELSLGFTFSFPMKQHSISSGELITWTKSFNCGGMAGVDVAALLQRCLKERGLKVTVQVLLNDTTGTLVAGAHLDPEVAIGVILGTGSNGCYMERADRVMHWESSHERVHDVCVDIEWGAFGDNGCLNFMRTEFDNEVDRKSLLATSFTFEKYIGGKYLGDLLCAVLGGLARDGVFPAAPTWGELASAHVSMFEEENDVGEWKRTAEALCEACGGSTISRADALVAQHVARVISNRAAQLVSVCISIILRRMERNHTSVAVDGSVFKRHPRIAKLMNKYISLLAPKHKFTLLGAEDGSGKGSALTAAIAARVAARQF